jgi:hypothetical protein
MVEKIYYPYPSNKPNKKYYIITAGGKKVYFGSKGYEDFTTHKDEERKQRYIQRHQAREDWGKSGVDSAGWFSRWLLWEEPNIKDAYKKIKDKLLRWGIISREQYNQYVF